MSDYRTFAEFHLRLDVWYTEVDILNCTRLVFFSSVSRPASPNRSSSHSVCPHSLHEMHKICKWTLFKLCKFMLNCLSCPLCPGTDSQLPASPPIIASHVHPVLFQLPLCFCAKLLYKPTPSKACRANQVLSWRQNNEDRGCSPFSINFLEFTKIKQGYFKIT